MASHLRHARIGVFAPHLHVEADLWEHGQPKTLDSKTIPGNPRPHKAFK